MKISFSNHVWSIVISPRDRKLKNRLKERINEHIIDFSLFDASDETIMNSNCAKYYLARSNVNKFIPECQKKLLVIFPGRNFNFLQKG